MAVKKYMSDCPDNYDQIHSKKKDKGKKEQEVSKTKKNIR